MVGFSDPGGDANGFDAAVCEEGRSGDVNLLEFAETQRTFSGVLQWIQSPSWVAAECNGR